MINIYTSRLFIPRATGWTRNEPVFGIYGHGYDVNRYELLRAWGNEDDVFELRDFYDVMSASYNMDLSQMPRVAPFVRYVNFMRPRGEISANDKDVIEYLKTHCNTLIITDKDEHEYVKELYLNMLRRDFGLFEFKPKTIPSRFQQKVR